MQARANGIPTGLCYQCLSVGNQGEPYGWYRVDARGNKPGVNAQFTPPREALAFTLKDQMERDPPEIWAEPLPLVVQVLNAYKDVGEVLCHLPDVPLLPA